MTELELYKHVIKLATAFQAQYREVSMLTLEGDILTLTVVNHQAPTLSRKFTCDITDKKARLVFASTLMDLRFTFERERMDNIRHGFSVALQHMKDSVLDALDTMSAEDIKALVTEELQKRRKKQ